MRLLLNLLRGLTIVGILAASQIASAGTVYPQTLNGTSWNVWVNNSYQSNGLTLYQTGSVNGCNEISGAILNGDTIWGFYCNDSGQIGFIRQKTITGELYQYYRGTLSGGSPCGVLFLSGSVMAWNTVANGTPGEFSFFATYGPFVC